MTDGFQGENRDMARVLVRIARMDASAWAVLGSAEEFELAKAAANKHNRSPTVLALATQAECDAVCGAKPAWLSRHVLSFKKFLSFVTRAGTANWRDGIQ